MKTVLIILDAWSYCLPYIYFPVNLDYFHIADFEILAFPCNQFGGQEPGSNEEIVEFACTRFKAEYPIFDKVIIWILCPPIDPSVLMD